MQENGHIRMYPFGSQKSRHLQQLINDVTGITHLLIHNSRTVFSLSPAVMVQARLTFVKSKEINTTVRYMNPATIQIVQLTGVKLISFQGPHTAPWTSTMTAAQRLLLHLKRFIVMSEQSHEYVVKLFTHAENFTKPIMNNQKFHLK